MATYQKLGTECLLYTKQVKGSVPFYRYRNGGIDDRFYTTDPDEIGVATPGETGKYEDISEGIVGYCFPKAVAGKGLVPFHRLVLKESFSDHFYTADAKEIGTVLGHVEGDGYIYKGVACYVVPYSG